MKRGPPPKANTAAAKAKVSELFAVLYTAFYNHMIFNTFLLFFLTCISSNILQRATNVREVPETDLGGGIF